MAQDDNRALLREDQSRALLRAMPAVFVLVWSTGFIVARYGMPHAPPLGFLSWRYAFSVLAFGLWIVLARVALPRDRAQWFHLALTGVLMHAGYLGGVWAAVKMGISAGTVALIVGLQPVLTAIWLSATSTHRVTPRQWLGLALGLAGLLLVVWRKLGLGEITTANFALSIGALVSMTVGTLYQKRYLVPGDVRAAMFVQLLAAFIVTLPLALWLESEPVRLHPELIAAMTWSVLVLTLGGSSLLFMLIQRGAAAKVTSLLYLVPPCTAVMAWALFGEALGLAVLAGLALTAIGVSLVVRDGGS